MNYRINSHYWSLQLTWLLIAPLNSQYQMKWSFYSRESNSHIHLSIRCVCHPPLGWRTWNWTEGGTSEMGPSNKWANISWGTEWLTDRRLNDRSGTWIYEVSHQHNIDRREPLVRQISWNSSSSNSLLPDWMVMERVRGPATAACR